MWHCWDWELLAYWFEAGPSKTGCYGNREVISYNGESGVSNVSRPSLIRSSSNLQVARTGIRSRTNPNFSQIRLLTSELFALELRKKSLYGYNGENTASNFSWPLLNWAQLFKVSLA